MVEVAQRSQVSGGLTLTVNLESSRLEEPISSLDDLAGLGSPPETRRLPSQQRVSEVEFNILNESVEGKRDAKVSSYFDNERGLLSFRSTVALHSRGEVARQRSKLKGAYWMERENSLLKRSECVPMGTYLFVRGSSRRKWSPRVR